MSISYDAATDTLYVTFAKPITRSEYVEAEGGILRIDEASNTVVGVTIPAFIERTARGKRVDIREIGAVPFTDELRDLLTEA